MGAFEPYFKPLIEEWYDVKSFFEPKTAVHLQIGLTLNSLDDDLRILVELLATGASRAIPCAMFFSVTATVPLMKMTYSFIVGTMRSVC